MDRLDLQEIRGKLDQVDAKLAELFEERMKLCADVAEFKMGSGKAVYDPAREKEKLSAIRGYAMDSWVRQRGSTAVLTYPDYKILWFFLKRRMTVMVYLLCVLRRAAVLVVHRMRRKG